MIKVRFKEVFPLKVRRRQVLHGDGERSVESVVPCARRGPGTRLATCTACEHSLGLQNDATGRCSYVLCRAGPPASIEPRRRGSRGTSNAERTPVAVAMTGNVLCVREDVSIESLTALFLERGISGAPVVDAGGFAIGVVSKTDIVRERYENGESVDVEPVQVTQRRGLSYALGEGFHSEAVARGTVSDIMTPLAFTLHESTPISQAAALMAYEGMHRVPVVSDDGRVVGVLSSLDLMRWLAEDNGYLVRDPTPERCV